MYTVITRVEAKRRGMSRYFTGKPCKRGHVAERNVSSWGCVECATIQSRDWTQRHGHRPYCPTRYKRLDRFHAIKRLYGLTSDEYTNLFETQRGRCAICDVVFVDAHKSHRAVVDHNHDTGEVRALLCAKCNLGLGAFGDDARVLQSAADYLKSHNC